MFHPIGERRGKLRRAERRGQDKERKRKRAEGRGGKPPPLHYKKDVRSV